MPKPKINNIATKDDLKNLATKDDLEEVKRDVEDIKATMATKDDLKRFATKDDLQDTEQRFKNELWKVEQKFEEKLEDTFRKYKDDTLRGLDPIAKQLETIGQELTAHQAKHTRIDTRPWWPLWP